MDHGTLEHNEDALEITFFSVSSTMPLDCLTQLA
jgi:hypothetical protein